MDFEFVFVKTKLQNPPLCLFLKYSHHTFENTTTDASVHDSRALEGLLGANDEGQDLHADSAYTGKNLEKTISERKMTGKIIEKRL